MLVRDHEDAGAGLEDLRRLRRVHQALERAIDHNAGLAECRDLSAASNTASSVFSKKLRSALRASSGRSRMSFSALASPRTSLVAVSGFLSSHSSRAISVM